MDFLRNLVTYLHTFNDSNGTTYSIRFSKSATGANIVAFLHRKVPGRYITGLTIGTNTEEINYAHILEGPTNFNVHRQTQKIRSEVMEK